MPVHEELLGAWHRFVNTTVDALEPVAASEHRHSRSHQYRLPAIGNNSSEPARIDRGRFTFWYAGDHRELIRVTHENQPIQHDAFLPVNRAEEVVKDIHSVRSEVLSGASDCRPELHAHLHDVREQLELIPETLTVAGLIEAVRHYHRPVIARAFGIGTGSDLPPSRHDVNLPTPDVSGLLSNRVERVPYSDHELALVVPFVSDGESDVAYAVGRDDSDTGFFAHEVDAVRLDPEQSVTRDQLLDALGFDRSLRPDERRLDVDPDERVRLQGDLAITEVEPDGAPVDSLIPSRSAVRNDILESYVKDYLSDAYSSEFAAAFDVRVPRRRGRYDFRVHRDESCTTTASAVCMMEEELDINPDRRPSCDDLSRETTNARYSALQRLVEQDVRDHIASVEDRLVAEVDRERKRHRDRVVREMGQLNLPIDNHLVIADRAELHGRATREEEPVDVVVPEETTLHALHDEHAQVDVRLPPGVYRLFLLPRGVRRRHRNRPSWESSPW